MSKPKTPKDINVLDHITAADYIGLMKRLKCKNPLHRKLNTSGIEICQHGCDCLVAREVSYIQSEVFTGCNYEKNFSTIKGLTLRADGYEEPFVVMETNGPINLISEDCAELIKLMQKVKSWCEHGWCPGS